MHQFIYYLRKSILLIGFLYSLSISAQTVSVTFQVDMSNETISSSGVHIAGNFQSAAGLGSDWNPGSTPLSDTNGDEVYEITVLLPSGAYEYKFINGNAWGTDENPPSECSIGNTNNRGVSIGNTDLVLPPVPFNSCIGSVKFAINMRGQTISPDGVHVMGNFQEAAGFTQNWDASSIQLEDVNADNTYEIELTLPAGDYEYLFVNGNETVAAEVLPSDCAVLGNNNTNNRTISVGDGAADLPTYCFNTCEECDPYLSTDFATHWWNDAVFYEIFVRSFYDSDGDGVGDFQGIIEKLDYLNDGNPDTKTDLGVTALWLMPMMESPSYHGYDVTNYYETEPDYGTMEDFEELLEAAHTRGIKVIIDYVMNHTSRQHPWFTQSADNETDYRDWYVWSDENPGFLGPWGQGVWHGNGGDYYYGLFWGGMPDLNYNHPPVKEEMFNIANFWLDKGVDGFRLDAIKYLVEDGTVLENTPETFSLLEEFNDEYTANNAEAFTIGEVWSSTNSIIPYVQNERLDVCFDFDLANDILSAVNSGNATSIQQQMQEMQAAYPALQYGTFLTNHDMDRAYNRVSSNAEKMKLAASMYLTLPGIPFLYYGEEVSMTGTGPHENIRRPMQWSDEAHAGFSSTSPWNGVGANYTTNNVAIMEANSNSLLNHYKKLIHIRHEQVALRRGNYLNVENGESKVMSFARTYDNEGVIVVSNLGTSATNPSLNLAVSNLTEGLYFVTDLYHDEALGTVSINENGGFENWQFSSAGLDGRTTSILLISEDNPVSVAAIPLLDFDFDVFPNPTSGQTEIYWEGKDAQEATVSILSASGLKLYEGKMTGQSLTISTNNWAKGLYFIKITIDGGMRMKRLVVL